jgi:membrane-associated phospholipid phosphatase
MMIMTHHFTEEKFMRRLNLVDGLTILFISLVLLLVLLLYPRFPNSGQLVADFSLLLLLAFFISEARRRWPHIKTVRVICDFSPVFFIAIIFELLGRITPYVCPDIDNLMIRIDLALFGAYPTVWLERFFIPWVADLLALAYISYYFIPLILIIILYISGKEKEFFITVATLLLGYYLCYAAYIVLPAVGPRFTLASLQHVPLKGGAILDWVVNTLNALEANKHDCFPSGHTQIVLISLWFAFKYKRSLFWVYLPITLALIFSTVYLRYHYVIDVIAGTAYAGISVLLGVRLWTWWEGYQKTD